MKKLAIVLLPVVLFAGGMSGCAIDHAAPFPHPVPVEPPEPEDDPFDNKVLCIVGATTAGVAEITTVQHMLEVDQDGFVHWFWYEAVPTSAGAAAALYSCVWAFQYTGDNWIYYTCGGPIRGFQMREANLDQLQVFWTFSCDNDYWAVWNGSFIN